MSDDWNKLKHLVDLSAENARLKAEVKRLTAELSNISGWGRGLESDLSHARVEISFLKAENERLTERNKFLEQIDSYLQGANENAYEKRCDELEAEVERLRKAGDALYDLALPYRREYYPEGEAWYLAKKGKPSV